MGLLVLFAVILVLAGCGRGPESNGPSNGRASPPPTPTSAPKADLKVEGRILFAKGGRIWTWDNGSTRELTKAKGDLHPDWSPDGRRIAFARAAEGYSDILTINPSGGELVNLTRFASYGADTWAFRPRWSPDGIQIAYLSEPNTYDLALWLMKADGAGKRQASFMNDYLGGIDTPAWHPKGDRLAFTAYRTGKPQVWALTLANSRWQQLTNTQGSAYDPQWSPSGEELAFVSRQDGKSDIWIMPAAGGSPVRVTNDGLSRAPAWSPDGNVLAYASGQGDTFDLWAVGVERTAEGLAVAPTPRRVTKGLGLEPGGGLSWRK